jgi:hypothetical protein
LDAGCSSGPFSVELQGRTFKRRLYMATKKKAAKKTAKKKK